MNHAEHATVEVEWLQGLVDREATSRLALTDCNKECARLLSANRRLRTKMEQLEEHHEATMEVLHGLEQRYQLLIALVEPVVLTVGNLSSTDLQHLAEFVKEEP